MIRCMRRLVALFLLTSIGFAQDETSSDIPQVSEESTSFFAGPKYGAGARLGWMFSAIPGLGIEGNYKIAPQWQLGLLLAGGSRDLKSEAEDSVEEELRTNTQIDELKMEVGQVAAYAKWNLGDSFYLTSGLSYRLISTDLAVSEKSDPDNFIKISTESPAICLDFGLGNIWRFDNGFYLGAEWIGFSAPLTSNASSKTETGGSASDDLDKTAADAKELAEDLGKATTIHLLVLHLGMEF